MLFLLLIRLLVNRGLSLVELLRSQKLMLSFSAVGGVVQGSTVFSFMKYKHLCNTCGYQEIDHCVHPRSLPSPPPTAHSHHSPNSHIYHFLAFLQTFISLVCSDASSELTKFELHINEIIPQKYFCVLLPYRFAQCYAWESYPCGCVRCWVIHWIAYSITLF